MCGVRLLAYACKHPDPALRRGFIPLGELVVLLGANDVGKSTALRAVTRDLAEGHFDEVDEEVVKLIGGVFYAELTENEVGDVIRKTAYERRRLRGEHQLYPDSERPPWDPGMWTVTGLSEELELPDALGIAVEKLRERKTKDPDEDEIIGALAESRLVGFECAGFNQRRDRVWNVYWCLPALGKLGESVRKALGQSNIERFARQRAKAAGEGWLRKGSAGFYDVQYGRPLHLCVEEAPIAVVSLGSTTEIPLPRGLAVPAAFPEVREDTTEAVNSLANVMTFAREDAKRDGDPLLPEERQERIAPRAWLEVQHDASYKVAPGARAACAFISAAANRGLPPFVAERYSVRARLRPLPEWFGVDPLDLELRDAPGRGTGEFSIEHVAEGFRLWVQLALLDALEDAARVESFLLRLASHWREGAETASQMYALEDEDAEVADSNADQLWEQFDTAVDELLDLEVADPGWLSGELADFLAEAPEDDWTKSRGRTGRLFAGSA
jgi:hypothetical protein